MAVLGEELQWEGKVRTRRPALPGGQAPLVIQRPVLNELVRPDGHTIHAHIAASAPHRQVGGSLASATGRVRLRG
jgi:hypothetical protein